MRVSVSLFIGATLFICAPDASCQSTPHKYLADWSEDRRMEVVSSSVAEFATASGSIPIVASAEPARVNLSWWNRVRGRWETRGIDHTRVTASRRTIEEIAQGEWSTSVGIAAASGNAFLVFMRSLPGRGPALYIARYSWDETTGMFAAGAEGPLRVPLGFGVRPGLYLAAGYSAATSKLWLLAQTQSNGVFRLTLLSVDLSSGLPALSNSASWRSVSIGQGGFDLDVLARDAVLHAVFRPATYPISGRIASTRATAGMGPPSPLGVLPDEDARYAPLEVHRIDLASGSSALLAQIPGGEHPQIQSITPLRVTVDRIESGSIRPEYFALLPRQYPLVGYSVEVRTLYKMLLEQTANGWDRGRLFTIDHQLIPRHILAAGHLGRHVMGQISAVPSSPSEREVRVATVYGFTPAYLVNDGTVEIDREKVRTLDFVFHRRDFGVLAVTRYSLEGTTSLTVRELGYTVLDVNHAQLPASATMTPSGGFENDALGPFAAGEVLITDTFPAFRVPSYQSVDNTIGGALTVDRAHAGLTLFAYSDLGDGGLRVIYDQNLPTPTPVASTKYFNDAAVSGPQAPRDEWRTVSLDGWTPAQLARQRNYLATRVMDTNTSGLAALFEIIFDLSAGVTREPDPDAPSEITRHVADGTQSSIEGLVEAFSAIPLVQADGGATPRATFTYRPSVLFAWSPITFDASGSVAASAPAALFSWKFGDDPFTAASDSPTITHTWYDPDTIPVTLRVAYPGGDTSVAQTEVTVTRQLWDELWAPHDEVNSRDGRFTVRNATMSLLNMTVDFELVEPGPNKLFVRLSPSPTYTSDIRLAGGEGGAQGLIHHRFPIVFETQEVDMHGLWQVVIGINRLRAGFWYSRAFTPSIAMRDGRRGNVLLNSYDRTYGDALVRSDGSDPASVLTAKPIGSTTIDVERIEVDFAFRTYVWAAMIALLISLGLAALAEKMGAILARGVVSLTLPGGALWSALLFVGLVAFVTTTVMAALRAELVSSIDDSIRSVDTKARLDGTPLIWYAGEGAAEVIAQRVLTDAGIGLSADGQRAGARYEPQLYQMIHVTDNQARVLIRR